MPSTLYVPPSLHEAEIERWYEDAGNPHPSLFLLATAMRDARLGAEQLL